MRSRYIILPLFKDLLAVTDGASGGITIVELDVPQFSRLLPEADVLDLFTNTKNITTNFRWNVEVIPGFDRNNESPAFPLLASDIGANGSVRQPPYTTTSNFQLHGRLRLMYRNLTGQTGANSAVISAALGMKLAGT